MNSQLEFLSLRIEHLPAHIDALKTKLADTVEEAEARPDSAVRSLQAIIEAVVGRVYETLLSSTPGTKPFFDQLRALEARNAIRPSLINHLNYLRVFRNKTTHSLQIETDIATEDFQAIAVAVLVFVEWAATILRTCNECKNIYSFQSAQCPFCGKLSDLFDTPIQGPEANFRSPMNDGPGINLPDYPDELMTVTFRFRDVHRVTSAYLGSAEDDARKLAEAAMKEWQKRVSGKLAAQYRTLEGFRRSKERVFFPDGLLTYTMHPEDNYGGDTISLVCEPELVFQRAPPFALTLGFDENPTTVFYEFHSLGTLEELFRLQEQAGYTLAGWDENELTFAIADIEMRVGLYSDALAVEVRKPIKGLWTEHFGHQDSASLSPSVILAALKGDPTIVLTRKARD
jgi:hypothetical protein